MVSIKMNFDGIYNFLAFVEQPKIDTKPIKQFEKKPEPLPMKKLPQPPYKKKDEIFDHAPFQVTKERPFEISKQSYPLEISNQQQQEEKKKRGRKPKTDYDVVLKENPENSDHMDIFDNEIMEADSNQASVNIYDKYLKLLESIITHEELFGLNEVPLFLIPPSEGSHLQNQFRQENGGIGYLNFNMILHRLKTKKYGPGKNMIKEEVLKHHITNVFRNCVKYYQHDPISMRLYKILEAHY